MKCGVIFICLWIGVIADGNFSFTYNMALRCKEHICQHGYSYETFYRVQNNLHSSGDAAFEMHLAILASSNGHILLSTTAHPEAKDPVYEIVVGGGGNKFTELRRNLRRNAQASTKTVGILSPIEFRAFYIRISEDGLVEIGKEGEELAFLTYTDIRPLTINYFSFAAWNGVEAKFLYDCPPPGNNTAISPDSQEVEQKLTSSEKLKRTLLMDRQPNTPPDSEITVKVGVSVTSVKYDVFESKLSTGIAIVTSWTDNNMAWNPSKFNGTTSLTFRQGQIWRPTFFVFNSDDINIIDAKNPQLITMENSGEATFHFQTKLNTWCYDHKEVYNTWPNDKYSCSIIIGPWEAHEKIDLEIMDADEEKMMIFTDIDEVVKNEWDIEMKMGIVPINKWNQFFVVQENQTYQSDKLILSITMKRNATLYNIVFYTPLLVLVSFVLMSFWHEPLQMSRIWFYACSSSINCMGLCYIDNLVPSHKVPSILVLYVTVLMGILMALLIHVFLIRLSMSKQSISMPIQSMLITKWFRAIFCLPMMTTCRNFDSINEAYATQEDDDSGVGIASRNSNVEEMQPDPHTYGEMEELAEAIDKLLFVIYSVVFAVMLALHY